MTEEVIKQKFVTLDLLEYYLSMTEEVYEGDVDFGEIRERLRQLDPSTDEGKIRIKIVYLLITSSLLDGYYHTISSKGKDMLARIPSVLDSMEFVPEGNDVRLKIDLCGFTPEQCFPSELPPMPLRARGKPHAPKH